MSFITISKGRKFLLLARLKQKIQKVTALSDLFSKSFKTNKIATVFRSLGLMLVLAWSSFLHADVPPLSTQGYKVLVGGEPRSLAGMSLFWNNDNWGGEKFYNADAVATLKNDWKASIVRAAMGVEDDGGYFTNPTSVENKVRRVVEAAIANDMYVIIDWHSHNAHLHDWSQARNFFQRMAQDYGHHNNIIYEVYNEPLQIPWADIKPYAESVIDVIRAVDPDNLIIVGTPTWSQGVVEASHNPIQRNNIAYTLHFYAGTHHQWLRNDAQQAMNNGIPLYVTEWGTVNANGDGGVNEAETQAWMDFLKNNDIHHANWSLNDKAEGASALVPGANTNGGWPDSQLTWSGAVVKNYLASWPQIPGDTDTPNVSILSPAENTQFISGSEFSLNFSFEHASSVKVNINGATIYNGLTQSPVVLTAPNTNGPFSVELIAQSAIGVDTSISTTRFFEAINDSSNTAPNASFSFSISGNTVSVDASASSDADGDALTYQWDFNGAARTGVQTSYTFPAPGTYPISLSVSDGTTTSTVSESVVIQGDGNANCDFVIENEWDQGFVATIYIHNTGTSTIDGWQIQWQFPAGVSMQHGWGADFSLGNLISASPLSWNRQIYPGNYTSVGMVGQKPYGTSAPTPQVMGDVCQ